MERDRAGRPIPLIEATCSECLVSFRRMNHTPDCSLIPFFDVCECGRQFPRGLGHEKCSDCYSEQRSGKWVRQMIDKIALRQGRGIPAASAATLRERRRATRLYLSGKRAVK